MSNQANGPGPMLPAFTVLLIVLLLGSSARAGLNENGVVLLHTDDTAAYTQEEGRESYVSSEIGCPVPGNQDLGLGDCADCDGRMGALNPTSGRGVEPTVWWAFVAFPEETLPAVRAIAFGHRWTGNLEILDYGIGPDMMDVPDPTWPYESGSGVGVAWRNAQRSRLTEVYWMVGYVDGGEAVLELIPHPAQGGAVADDRRNIAPLVGYGRLGLGGAEGYNPAPLAMAFGGCCLGTTQCVLVTEEQCGDLAGLWLDGGCPPESCDPGDARFVVEELAPVVQIEEGAPTTHPIRVRNDGTEPLYVRFELDPGVLPPIDADFAGDSFDGRGIPFLRKLLDNDVLMNARASSDICDPLTDRVLPWLQSGRGLYLELDRPADLEMLGSLGIEGLEVVPSTGRPEPTSAIADHLALRGITDISLPSRRIRIEGPGAGISWTPLVLDGEGKAVMAVAKVGLGRVFLTTYPLGEELRRPIAQWLSGTDRDIFEPRELVLGPGELGETVLSFPPNSLFDGTYEAAVGVLTNDVDRPFVQLPLTLEIETGDDGLWVTDVVDFGPIPTGTKASMDLELINLSGKNLSLASVECDDPQLGIGWSSGVIPAGGRTTMHVDLASGDRGPFGAELAITSSRGTRRFVDIRAEFIENPQLEFVSSEIVLVVRSPDLVAGSIQIRNAAADPRAVLEWSVDVPTMRDESADPVGSCGFWIGTGSDHGTVPGETTDAIGFVSRDADLFPDALCSITLRTNDPAYPTVEIPVRVSEGGDAEDIRREIPVTPPSQFPTEAGLRLETANPCRGRVLFALDVPDAAQARFDVHDATGRCVWSYDRKLNSGTSLVDWFGDSSDGRVPTGVYWGVLSTSEGNRVQRVVLVR